MEAYRSLFPITRERAYLNHAALGPLSTRAVEALAEHARGQALQADHATEERKRRREATRAKLAALIGAAPSEVAMVKHTPDALGMVAVGLRWRPGDQIVSSDQEFPANIDRTRLVTLSWVEFSTGYRNDLATIGRACHARGASLAVDGIQGIGALRFDARALEVDFLGFSSHKWLLGPLGVGWFYCRRELQRELDVVMIGPGSVDQGSSWLDYERELWPDARRFESGAANSLGLAGVEAALDVLAEVGMERVEAQIRALTDRLASGLEERGYRLAVRRGADDWSGVVSFSSERHTPEELHACLEQARISTSVREGRVRVSPHFYNSADEIDTLLAALPTA